MRVPLSIVAVPKQGKLIVRFLCSPRGILTHWVKGRTTPCPGDEQCQRHDYPIWKGYAASQVWVKAEHFWRPAVFEMTISLVETVGSQDLRGKCYSVQRLKTEYGKKACSGLEIDAGDLGRLPPPFDVEAAVQRLYRTRAILWDIAPDLYLRDTAETSQGDEPFIPGQSEKSEQSPTTASFSEVFRRNTPLNGKPVKAEESA